MKTHRIVLSLAIAASLAHAAPPATRPAASKPARKVAPPPAVGWKNGTLSYAADARGNRVPDFSYAGYAAGEKPIPLVPAKLKLGDPAGDGTDAVQAAIDQVSKLPADADGFRGAVLLPPGTYKLAGTVTIRASGVVLRGSGPGEHGTTLLATGVDRRTVVHVRGAARPMSPAGQPITDAYVPVNATAITLADAGDFKPGDAVTIRRPSTPEWIAAIGMDDLGGDRHGPSWRPGSRDVVFDRVVTKVDGRTLTLDAPLTIALDSDYGGATVAKTDWPGRVTNVGVENLRIVSAFEEKRPKDEEHAWFGVAFDNARDGWVRQVTFEHLAGSAVAAWESSSRITVEDCKSLAPVGEIGGLRRYSFFTDGQQVLMQRLYSESGYHDFAVGFAAAGPNAFVQCESHESLGESGAIDSAACGTLFDRCRIDGQPLSLRNRTYQGQGVGWASFNGTIWNSVAPLISLWQPPGAQNWAFGASGEFEGTGAYSGSNDDVNPDCLFYAQLADRLGRDAERRAQLNLPGVQGSRAPTVEDTAKIIARSYRPRVTMADWVDAAGERNPIATSADGVPTADRPASAGDQLTRSPKRVEVRNGWLLVDGKVAVGGKIQSPWWNGGVRPADLDKANVALTRFVPGRTGTGLTDDVADVVTHMRGRGATAYFQYPPLWYERRRDDHERVQRIDGDVVAPFYETPWARSGVGRASDGLSKFDVTRPDTWYYNRLRQFADLGAPDGLLLFNGLYMQHNILEAGAHYADAPWRPQNNVNPVGIPEPVFFAGDKLIYVAEQFYDVTNPDRAALHRTYIRNALNELADKPNVIFYLSEEYTGPLAFTQFWLDTIAEWEKETGKTPLIALYAPKDVQDAILADPKRAAVVSLIYNSFDEGDAGWWYQPDGTLYAPPGGKNLSPRQWIRLLKPKSADFEGVLKAVRDMRLKYPDKPFVYTGNPQLGWAVMMGGGSLAPVKLEPELAAALPMMKPLPATARVYGLADTGNNQLLCAAAEVLDGLVQDMFKEYDARRIDMKTGQSSPWRNEGSRGSPSVVWLHKK